MTTNGWNISVEIACKVPTLLGYGTQKALDLHSGGSIQSMGHRDPLSFSASGDAVSSVVTGSRNVEE